MLVTISGADDNVNPDDLVDLSQRYPFVEWGILHSTKLCGTKRYPSGAWITRLASLSGKHEEVNLSAHLCGEMAERYHVSLASLHAGFGRVQYNGMLPHEVKPDSSVAYQYEHIIQVRSTTFFSAALSHVEDYSARMSVMWDASGGRGKSPEFWIVPTGSARWGLAGGLGPGHCAKVVPLGPAWIDMESGVRTENDFDLSKVEAVLKEVESSVIELTFP